MSELVTPVGHQGMGERSALSLKRDGEDFCQMLLGAEDVELGAAIAFAESDQFPKEVPVPVAEDESSRIYGFGQFSSLKLSYVSAAYRQAEVVAGSAPVQFAQHAVQSDKEEVPLVIGYAGDDTDSSGQPFRNEPRTTPLADVMAVEAVEIARAEAGYLKLAPIVARKMAMVPTSDGQALVIRDYHGDPSAMDIAEILSRCKAQGMEPQVVILNGKRLGIDNLRGELRHGG